MSHWVAGHPKLILVLAVAGVGLIGVGITWVKVDTNVVNYFPPEDPLVVVVLLKGAMVFAADLLRR